jgi:hypothetical protein
MNATQIRRYEMLVRVRDFGNAHADLFPEPGLARPTFAAVTEAVEQLNTHTVAKLSAVQGITTKAKARAALLERVEAIGQTGRVIAEKTPGLDGKFAVPSDPSDQALLMTARLFASEAEPLKDQFVEHLMPETFLAELEEATGRFERLRGDQATMAVWKRDRKVSWPNRPHAAAEETPASAPAVPPAGGENPTVANVA